MKSDLKDHIKSILDALAKEETVPHFNYLVPQKFFATKQIALEFIKQCFIRYDPAITEQNYEKLPEYDKVADYLCETKYQGLAMLGECGTGKSNILKFVLPKAYKMFNKIAKPASCYHLHNQYDKIIPNQIIILDEVGVERIGNDYGIRYNMIANIIGLCEDERKALFFTSNLNYKQIFDNYGKRSLDRISKRCKIIEFESKSLR
jgi:DNA replication protein DnaC